MHAAHPTINQPLDQLIVEAMASGGSERANYQLFVERLCGALDLDKPQMAAQHNELNDYVFERRIAFKHPDGSSTSGFIDCYRRGHFILEAKQTVKRGAKPLDPDQLSLLGEDAGQVKSGQATRGTAGWDQVMLSARKQAEGYARALPVEHGYPPFLLVVDVGNVIEVFADFSGQGKNYAHFPDRRSYRIGMEDLRDEKIQERLRAIWTDPLTLDPARVSAKVTSDITARLARVAKRLEGRHDPKDVAEFLMRTLFTMFAEDVGLLPEKSFCNLLGELKDKPELFVPALETLWTTMDEGGYEPRMMARIKIFNGSLFKSRCALPLDREEITELWVAARQNWRDVEPAIFGTLLERALDPRERAKLGAHYTPRAYVERLVIPTIIEPLRSDWALVQGRVADLRKTGDAAAALALVKDFHHELCTVTVLDPACGTGNFLYVSLELMKRLEGEVLDALDALGENQARLAIEGETVSPKQFFGLEINPRAVAIADLVLWIGYLKWQLRTTGLASITEPVINAYGTIVQQDAILAHDGCEVLLDADGLPRSRWDGVTKKLHPITGEEIPDPDARTALCSYRNPRPAQWPEVDFIVGNPPFIGGKDMRDEFGDGYAEACWKARPYLPGGADFVMHFWDEAATRLLRKGTKTKLNRLRRFGFITTNSITQTFSRRVIERHLGAKEPLSLVYAIPDHPWLKASDRAAVRIAMTVAERGESEGVLAKVIAEEGLNTDTPLVELEKRVGKVRANISLGANLHSLLKLTSNASIAHMGVKLHGEGFILKNGEVFPGAEDVIFPFLNGRDIAQRSRGFRVVDLFAKEEGKIADDAPALFQYLLERVKPERLQNRRDTYRENWWIWGEPRREWRGAKSDLSSIIATARTAKHRVFQSINSDVVIESKIVGIAAADHAYIACLSSRIHAIFAMKAGGWLGVGNDSTYNHSDTFDPYPFPVCIDPRLPDNHPQAPLRDRLRALGERLDAFRKERLAAHAFLTMTGLYNVLERLRELENGASVEPLSASEKDIHEAGLVSVLKNIHDEIDRAVFEAYGFDDLAADLVGKPGATTPSAHKSPAQEAAEEELLTRLVALNLERHAEEKRGLVRWLRPDFQIPKLGHKVASPQGDQLFADLAVIEEAGKPKWPGDGLEQIRIVRDILVRAPSPAFADAIAASFDGRTSPKRRARVSQVLESLVSMGMVRTGDDPGRVRYFVPR